VDKVAAVPVTVEAFTEPPPVDVAADDAGALEFETPPLTVDELLLAAPPVAVVMLLAGHRAGSASDDALQTNPSGHDSGDTTPAPQ